MRRRLVALLVATVLAVGGAAACAPLADAACSLRVVYTLYPWGGGSFKTTYYDTYRYFVTHNMGVASYGWVC